MESNIGGGAGYSRPRERSKASSASKTLFRIGIIQGIGLIGALDEIILHQLLQWHNFYVHSTQFWRIFSDGLFHIFSLCLFLIATSQLWSKRSLLSTLERGRALVAGILLGMGGFNLYDGIIQHKLLQLHPVREGVPDQLPYDLAWNGLALLLIAGGWWLWSSVRTDNSRVRS
jgi:uncharacterized membrane protein